MQIAPKAYSLLMLLAATAVAQEVPLIEMEHVYQDENGDELTGILMYEDIAGSPIRPGLIVFPGPWGDGGSRYEQAVGRSYARKGMVVLLADYFTGKNDQDDVAQLGDAVGKSTPLLANTVRAQTVAMLAYAQLISLEITDNDKIGVMGFCFGGSVALNLARAGADLTVAASFHGGYPALGDFTGVWNTDFFVEMVGAADPTITADQRTAWVAELQNHTQGTHMNYDMIAWGNTYHAFSIHYPGAMYQLVSSAFTGGTIPVTDGPFGQYVPGFFQYDEQRSIASFSRVNDLFEEYGLTSPTMTTCGDVKDYYREKECCGQPAMEIPMMTPPEDMDLSEATTFSV